MNTVKSFLKLSLTMLTFMCLPVLHASISQSSFYSGDATATISNGTITLITPPPEANAPWTYVALPAPAKWVSNANTGWGGNNTNIPVSDQPLFTIYETFASTSAFKLAADIYGDDATSMSVNGQTVVGPANTGFQFATSYTGVYQPGIYTLGFSAYNYEQWPQGAGNLTGIAYNVSASALDTAPFVPVSTTPEPGMWYASIGSMLVIAGIGISNKLRGVKQL